MRIQDELNLMIEQAIVNNDIYQEAFVGKTKALLDIEKQLDIILTKIRQNPLADFTNSKENQQLEKLIKAAFGFKTVNFMWIRTPEAAPNVFTALTLNVILGDAEPKFLFDEKNGYYDSKHCHTCAITASSSMAVHLNLTAAEYMAIILHELGHNFDRSLWAQIYIIRSLITDLVPIIRTKKRNTIPLQITKLIVKYTQGTAVGKNVFAASLRFFEKILDVVPFFKKLGVGFNKLSSWLTKGIEYIIAIPGLLLSPVYALFSPLAQLINVDTRKQEEFADSFATFYGYGPELSSALSRLESVNLLKINKSNPFGGNSVHKFLTDTAIANRYLIYALLDGTHGSTGTRIVSMIREMENELKKQDLPANLKAALKKELDDTKKLYDIYQQAQYGESDDESLPITAAVRGLVASLFNGRSDYIAKLFSSNSAFVHAESVDEKIVNLKLSIYEKEMSGEITNVERALLLERLNDVE